MRSTVQVKIGIRNMVMPGARMQKIVVMKLTAPRIAETTKRQSEEPEVATSTTANTQPTIAAHMQSTRSRRHHPA